jgi:hypothetical protein
VARLTEVEARQALVMVGATQPARDYLAHRQLGGWLFLRSTTAADSLIGEYPWVVSDTGRATNVRVVESAIDALARMNRP